jgi:Helix-turn-helix domain/Homeodomain-like domain
VDRDQLARWLDDGLSLAQIGALADRHPSTVGYWVHKHGLRANGREKYAPKGGLTRDQLEPLVKAGKTLHEIAAELDCSTATIRHWIGRYELERPIDIRLLDRTRALASGARTLVRSCDRHGRTVFVIETGGRMRCRRCRMERVAEWRRRTKAKLVREAGGQCRLCGYDRCQAALEFHHLDPTAKSFGLSLRGVTRSINELRQEAAKCVLLCANCHAEVEAGYSKV